MITSNINNVSGFDHLEIELRGNAAIYTRAECQLIIDNNFTIEATLGGKGIISGVVRSFSTGTFFINKIFLKNEDITGGDINKPADNSLTPQPLESSSPSPLASEPLASEPLASPPLASEPLESSSVQRPMSVSYTHLTLPTILRV